MERYTINETELLDMANDLAHDESDYAKFAAECQSSRMIVIYQITCTKAYRMDEQGTGWSLAAWGENTIYYEGDDDGGSAYYLPDGYTVGQQQTGEIGVYDEMGSYCNITGRVHPHLMSITRSVLLRRV